MSGQDFNWKAFQKALNYSDEDLEAFKQDPRRVEAAKKLFTPEITRKDLIIEVVESHGCSCRLKPGDKLVFRALSQLDLDRSSRNWCAHAMAAIPGMATLVQDRYVSGLDLNSMAYNHFTCGDTGPLRNGWGQVVMKAYVVDRQE
jgi:uncharacterized repeat protein (TIGR04076 family)